MDPCKSCDSYKNINTKCIPVITDIIWDFKLQLEIQDFCDQINSPEYKEKMIVIGKLIDVFGAKLKYTATKLFEVGICPTLDDLIQREAIKWNIMGVPRERVINTWEHLMTQIYRGLGFSL